FAYADNDPIQKTDPSGMASWSQIERANRDCDRNQGAPPPPPPSKIEKANDNCDRNQGASSGSRGSGGRRASHTGQATINGQVYTYTVTDQQAAAIAGVQSEASAGQFKAKSKKEQESEQWDAETQYLDGQADGAVALSWGDKNMEQF